MPDTRHEKTEDKREDGLKRAMDCRLKPNDGHYVGTRSRASDR